MKYVRNWKVMVKSKISASTLCNRVHFLNKDYQACGWIVDYYSYQATIIR